MLKIIAKTSGFIAMMLIFGLFVLSLALLLGVSIGLGAILTLILPFDLFQASLLSLIAIVVVTTSWYNLLSSVRQVDTSEWDEDEDEELLSLRGEGYEEIPPQRFYKSAADQTWEVWFRYQVANNIYIEFLESPRPILGSMGPKQIQELAIRLADLAIAIFKQHPTKSGRITVSVNSMRKELINMGQKPYDDDILKLAVTAINAIIGYDDDLQTVIHEQSWDKTANLFDQE